MKLTIVILSLCGLLIGQATFAARPAAKPAQKAVAKAPARPVAARPAAKATPASRAPASATPRAVAPAPASSSQDLSGLSASIRSMSGSPSAGGGGILRGPGSSHEIGEAMRVTGQSRNLSMGLLFSKDNDKIEFGNPRMHYKDKISSKQANY